MAADTVSDEMIACVGAVIHDRDGRLLMIRRGQAPGLGLWSLPGGRVEPGETDQQAVVREVAEETALLVRAGRLVGRVRRQAPGGATYAIADYQCELIGGTVVAGDDADDVTWADPARYARLATVPGLTEVLTEWDMLPGRRPAPITRPSASYPPASPSTRPTSAAAG